MGLQQIQKSLFSLLALWPAMLVAQPYLLIDRGLKQPAEVVQELEPQKIWAQYFPVRSADVDSLIVITEQLIMQLDQFKPGPLAPATVAGQTSIVLRKSTKMYEQTFLLRVLSRFGNVGFALDLLPQTESPRKNLHRLRQFLLYLRHNRLLLRTLEQ